MLEFLLFLGLLLLFASAKSLAQISVSLDRIHGSGEGIEERLYCINHELGHLVERSGEVLPLPTEGDDDPGDDEDEDTEVEPYAPPTVIGAPKPAWPCPCESGMAFGRCHGEDQGE